MLPFQTAFIVNPGAGGGRAARIWRSLEPLLRSAGQPYRAYCTTRPGDATAIAEKACFKGAELIVAVGGDGTLLEVVNGLDLKKNILGIIPAGTGNGFRRSLGIPGNYRRVLLAMSRWKPRRIDIGIFNGIRYLNMAGFGFDAAIAHFAKDGGGSLPGYAAYVKGFFRELAGFRGFSVMIEKEGGFIEEAETLMVVVANGRYYGGKLCIAPHACVSDGELNLLLVRGVKNASTISLAARAFMKKHLGHSSVYTVPCRELTINVAGRVPVHIDGELLGSLPAKISVLPGALRVLAPPLFP